MENKPPIIGVTGGIGSGKSTVCKLFESLYRCFWIRYSKYAKPWTKGSITNLGNKDNFWLKTIYCLKKLVIKYWVVKFDYRLFV